jgi:hypothetical protein
MDHVYMSHGPGDANGLPVHSGSGGGYGRGPHQSRHQPAMRGTKSHCGCKKMMGRWRRSSPQRHTARGAAQFEPAASEERQLCFVLNGKMTRARKGRAKVGIACGGGRAR